MIHSENEPRIFHFVLLALGAAVLLTFLGVRVLNPTEARIGLAAQQAFMTNRSVADVISEMQFQIYPLPAWIIEALGYVTGGVREWTVRLPGCLALIGIGLIAFETARRGYGKHAGAVAFAVVCLSIPGIQAARGSGAAPVSALFI